MIGSLFHTALYQPIYNLLILFADIVPGGDVGIAVILVTLAVKLIIAPLSLSAIKTQRRMRAIEPQLKALREKHADDRQAQALAMMELYKNNGIKPFSSMFAMLIQIPIIFALYFVFLRESLVTVNLDLVYRFIPLPGDLSPYFLGIFEIAGTSVPLAVLAGIFQFALATTTIPVPPKTDAKKEGFSGEDFARAMAIQSRYVLPAIVGVFALVSGVIALYFITSSVFGIAQEYYARYRYPKLGPSAHPATA